MLVNGLSGLYFFTKHKSLVTLTKLKVSKTQCIKKMIRKNKLYFPKNSLFYVNFSIEAPFLLISAYITFAFITLQNLKLSKSKLIIFLIPVNDFFYSGRKFLIVIGGFHLHKTKKSFGDFSCT